MLCEGRALRRVDAQKKTKFIVKLEENSQMNSDKLTAYLFLHVFAMFSHSSYVKNNAQSSLPGRVLKKYIHCS
jgi:hypothetical protein